MSAAKQARVITPASKPAEQLSASNPTRSSGDPSSSIAPKAENPTPQSVIIEEDPVKHEPKDEAPIIPLSFDIPIPSLEQDDHSHAQQQQQQQGEGQQVHQSSMKHDMFTSGMQDFSYAHQDFSSVFGTPIATPTYC